MKTAIQFPIIPSAFRLNELNDINCNEFFERKQDWEIVLPEQYYKITTNNVRLIQVFLNESDLFI